MPLNYVLSTDHLTEKYDTPIEYREELYDDEDVLCTTAYVSSIAASPATLSPMGKIHDLC